MPPFHARASRDLVRRESSVVAEWAIWDVLWSMVWFFFLFIFIWMFIGVFADVFRRRDLSGWAKAGWLLLLVVLPFLGILIYTIARPRDLPQDREEMMRVVEQQRRVVGYSAADEIVKLDELEAKGSISHAEYERLKERALA
jgi:hypothetical protein